MSTADGLVTVEAVINPALYWVIRAKSKEYLIVGIYGITPQDREKQLVSSDNRVYRLLECWKRHNEEIKELFIGRKVEFIQKKLIDGVPFGNLFVYFGSFRVDVCSYLLDSGIAHISQYPDRDTSAIKSFSIQYTSQFPRRLKKEALKDLEVPKIKYPKRRDQEKLSPSSSCTSSLASFKTSSSEDISELSSLDKSFDSNSDPSSFKSSDAPSINIKRLRKFRFSDCQNISPNSSSNQDCPPLKPVDVTEEHIQFVDQFVRGNIANCTEEKFEFVRESLEDRQVEDINQQLISIMSLQRDTPTRQKPMGRGRMLKTILEGNFPLSSSSSESLPAQEMNSVRPLAPLPPKGKLRKVFSMDIYGATAHVDEAGKLVDRKPPPEMDFNAECSLSSSSSCESINEPPPQQNIISASDSNPSLNESSDHDESQQELLERELVPLSIYLDRLVAFGGLIHGDTSVLPNNNLLNMGLHPYVREALGKARITEVSRAGAFVMPAVLTRRSTVLIGPPLSKKTTSVVIALVSLLLEEGPYQSLRPGCGPRAVIIVPFAETVRTTAKLISLANPGYLITLTTCGGGLELERRVDLTNGCDILISTPRCWLRLLKHRFVTNQRRLCHLFVDQVNIVIDLFKPEFLEIIKLVENVGAANRVRYQQQVSAAAAGDSEKTIPPPVEPQIILVGDNWDPVLENTLLTRLKSPLLCLTSHLEAALYARVKPCVHFIKSNINKENKLISILSGKEKMRTVVACSSAADVRHLRTLLTNKRKHVIIAHGDLHHSMLREVHELWNSEKASEALLIVSDDVLNDLGINNAQALIHYNMPDSKTYFSNRFTAIRLCFTDRILHSDAARSSCSVDMMIDEQNAEQFPEIICFMSRLGTKIPADLQAAADKIKKIKESKKTTPLCKNVIMFGKCWKEVRCKDRHLMDAIHDKCRPGIPQNGAIYFELLHVFSAAHFSVRLVSHSASGNLSELKPLPFSKEYVHLCMRINTFYAIRDNRRVHGDVRVGALVAIESETDTIFKRAMVTKIVTKDNRQIPSVVNVKLIDFGTSEDKKISDLFFLPACLQDCPPQSCEIFICGLLPVDKDISWSYATTAIIKKEIKQLNKSLMLTAQIIYTISGKVLVKDIKAVEYLEDTQVWVTELSVKQTLLDRKLAEKNPYHLPILCSLTSDVGLLAPVIPGAESCQNLDSVGKPEGSSKVANGKVVAWAFLPSDEISCVNFTYAEDPSLLYVTNYKFMEQMLALDKDINKFMEKKVLRCEASDMYQGYICLAKNTNNLWNRARIEEMGVELSKNGEPLYKVMFVDYGDVLSVMISDMAPCPVQFIKILPFQAIECELTGLLPYHSGWSKECTDNLYEWTSYINDEDALKWKILHVKVIKKLPKAETTGGYHYSIIMIDSYSNPPLIINKELLTGGYANWNPDEKKFLTDEYFEQITSSLTLTNGSNNLIEEAEELEEGPVKSASELKSGDELETVKNTSEFKNGDKQDTVAIPKEIITVEELLERLATGEFDYYNPRPNDLTNLVELPPSKPMKAIEYPAKKIKSLTDSEDDKMSTTSKTSVSKFLKYSKRSKKHKKLKKEVESVPNNNKQQSEIPILIWDNGVLTPSVAWRQDSAFVVINILIPDVKKYCIEVSKSHIYFSTVVNNDRYYRLEVDLFGPVNACYHEAKGQYVLIKLVKAVFDVIWTRLTYFADGSSKWLKEYDNMDSIDDDESLLPKLLQIGENKMQLGLTNKSEVDGEIMADWNGETSESSGDEDSAEECLKEFDPYNPLG